MNGIKLLFVIFLIKKVFVKFKRFCSSIPLQKTPKSAFYCGI